ncbi:hypothetical protein OC834_000435 [Tilletia horrida]|nr:hypothetical protein OC834_000435 [Tilletia horrida]
MGSLRSLLLNETVVDVPHRTIRFPRTDAPHRGSIPLAEVNPGAEEVPLSKQTSWKNAVASYIADAVGHNKDRWKLASWPRGYYFAVQDADGDESRYIKGVFCDPEKFYDSPKKFAMHALWLCLDPKRSKCKCQYCVLEPPSAPESQEYSNVNLRPPGPDPWIAHTQSWAASAFVRVWASCRLRQSELEPITINGQPSQCLRMHEIVWLKLMGEPITGSDPSLTITHWPVHISERKAVSVVTEAARGMVLDESCSTVEDDEIEFDIEGNIVQEEYYYVQLVGLRQETLVPRKLLLPFLAYQPPAALLDCDPDHFDLLKSQWMLKEPPRPKWEVVSSCEALTYSDGPDDRAERTRRRPSFGEAMPAYALALSILSHLSTAVVGIKPFVIEAELPLLNMAKPSSAQTKARKDTMAAIKKAWILPKSRLWPELSPLNADYTTVHNTYYQGVTLGVERIWAGDVVRLEANRTDLQRLREEITAARCGTLPSADLDRLLDGTYRRAFLMDIDAIVKPGGDSDEENNDEQNLLFCGSLLVALHRHRDAELIGRYANLVREAPYDPAAFSLEWTRPRNTVLYTHKMPVSPELVFLPLLDAKRGHVAALPLTLIAGRWYSNLTLVVGSQSAERREAYEVLMDKLRRASSADVELPLSVAERQLVLEGWAPGGQCAMAAREMWDSLLEVHREAELTAREEVCEMLECERLRRLGRPRA